MLYISLILANLLIGVIAFPVLGGRKQKHAYSNTLLMLLQIIIINLFLGTLWKSKLLIPYILVCAFLLWLTLAHICSNKDTFVAFFIISPIFLIISLIINSSKN